MFHILLEEIQETRNNKIDLHPRYTIYAARSASTIDPYYEGAIPHFAQSRDRITGSIHHASRGSNLAVNQQKDR
jgi:hypothetical protein